MMDYGDRFGGSLINQLGLKCNSRRLSIHVRWVVLGKKQADTGGGKTDEPWSADLEKLRERAA